MAEALESRTYWVYRDEYPVSRHSDLDAAQRSALKQREHYPNSIVRVKLVKIIEQDVMRFGTGVIYA